MQPSMTLPFRMLWCLQMLSSVTNGVQMLSIVLTQYTIFTPVNYN